MHVNKITRSFPRHRGAMNCAPTDLALPLVGARFYRALVVGHQIILSNTISPDPYPFVMSTCASMPVRVRQLESKYLHRVVTQQLLLGLLPEPQSLDLVTRFLVVQHGEVGAEQNLVPSP